MYTNSPRTPPLCKSNAIFSTIQPTNICHCWNFRANPPGNIFPNSKSLIVSLCYLLLPLSGMCLNCFPFCLQIMSIYTGHVPNASFSFLHSCTRLIASIVNWSRACSHPPSPDPSSHFSLKWHQTSQQLHRYNPILKSYKKMGITHFRNRSTGEWAEEHPNAIIQKEASSGLLSTALVGTYLIPSPPVSQTLPNITSRKHSSINTAPMKLFCLIYGEKTPCHTSVHWTSGSLHVVIQVIKWHEMAGIHQRGLINHCWIKFKLFQNAMLWRQYLRENYACSCSL